MVREKIAKTRINVENSRDTTKQSDDNGLHGEAVNKVQLTMHMYESTISKTPTSTLWHNNTVIREGQTDAERQRQTRMGHGMPTYWMEGHSKHQSEGWRAKREDDSDACRDC